MLISNINLCSTQSKSYAYQNSNLAFQKTIKNKNYPTITSKEKFQSDNNDYKGVLSYSEVIALKEYADSIKIGKYTPNIAIEIHPDAVGNYIIVGNYDEVSKGKGYWVDITDYDNA